MKRQEGLDKLNWKNKLDELKLDQMTKPSDHLGSTQVTYDLGELDALVYTRQ